MRIGETSLVDAEGVMTDGDEEVKDRYASPITESVTARPRNTAAVVPPPNDCRANFGLNPRADHGSFALRFGIQNDYFIDANTDSPSTRAFAGP